MSAQAATLGTINAIVGFMGKLQINGTPAYSAVQAGATKNFKNALPAGMVVIKEIAGGFASTNAKVHDDITLSIITVVDYTDAALAEEQIANIRDGLSAIFYQRVYLGGSATVFDSHPVKEQFFFSKNMGEPYRYYVLDLSVTVEYYVPVGPGTD